MKTIEEIERELLEKELRAAYWEEHGFVPGNKEVMI